MHIYISVHSSLSLTKVLFHRQVCKFIWRLYGADVTLILEKVHRGNGEGTRFKVSKSSALTFLGNFACMLTALCNQCGFHCVINWKERPYAKEVQTCKFPFCIFCKSNSHFVMCIVLMLSFYKRYVPRVSKSWCCIHHSYFGEGHDFPRNQGFVITHSNHKDCSPLPQ